MTSEVEQKPTLVTGGYGRHRRHWVKEDVTVTASKFAAGLFTDSAETLHSQILNSLVEKTLVKVTCLLTETIQSTKPGFEFSKQVSHIPGSKISPNLKRIIKEMSILMWCRIFQLMFGLSCCSALFLTWKIIFSKL